MKIERGLTSGIVRINFCLQSEDIDTHSLMSGKHSDEFKAWADAVADYARNRLKKLTKKLPPKDLA